MCRSAVHKLPLDALPTPASGTGALCSQYELYGLRMVQVCHYIIFSQIQIPQNQ